MINQNNLKNRDIFQNIKKIDYKQKISSLNIDNINKKDSAIRIIPQDNKKLSIFSLFIGKNSNNSIIISIISFLSYRDLLELQKSSKKFYSILNNPKIKKEYILHSNICDNEHLLFYESNINIKILKNVLVKELNDYKISSKIYKNILTLSNESKEKNEKHSKVINEILRDINRTFFTEKFKKSNGKEMLVNILSALAFIRPEIGYCQGMNFIAGALIELIEEEEKIFWIFLSFIDNIDLNLLFLKNMPDYSIRLYQLNYYIKLFFPQLFSHFKKNQINPDIFFSKWILTIFANYLPFHKLYKIWDLFIIDKWKAIFRISMCLLGLMKNKLLELDLPKFCQYFKSEEIQEIITFKYICEHYKDFKITNKRLSELKEDFFVDEIKKKLNDENQEWDIDQKEVVSSFKIQLKNHEDEINEKINKLKDKIEKTNKKCKLNNQKYKEQLDIIKNYKLQLETKVEIKAGYEKVFKRNNGENLNNNNIYYNNNNNLNNINIGININVNHKIENSQNTQKNDKINIINNNNNIYVNNINIINSNHFNFNGDHQINNINNNNFFLNQKNLHATKSSSTYRNKNDKNKERNIKRKFSLKKFSSNFKIFSGKTNELDKIKNKIIRLDKEINSLNDELIKNYKILDQNRLNLEKNTSKLELLKKKLDEKIKESHKFETDLLKNLSQKLKLSVKFVFNNQY